MLRRMNRPAPPPSAPEASTEPIRLAAHGFAAELHREGATLARLDWRGRPLLRLSPDGPPSLASPNRFGLWPMVPFCNRAFGARMLDGAERIALPVNDPAMGACIHGFGWQAAWEVEKLADGEAVLVHRRAAGSDPYVYEARLRLRLAPRAARVSLAVTSRAARPLPFGVGLHPWFPAASDTTLTLAALGALALGPGYRARGLDPWPGGGPFAAGAPVLSPRELALGIVGWRGEAVLETPSAGLRLRLDASGNLRHPVLWTPPDADFVCLEPQSHGLGAASEEAARAVTPLARLAPGETLEGWMEIGPEEL